MAVRLIALDLDGTLLTSDKRLTDRTRRALRACIDRGIRIVPATGRTPQGIPAEVKEISGVQYAISANGAAVYDLLENRRIVRTCIPYQDALAVVKLIAGYPLMYDAYIEGRGKIEARFLNSLESYGLQPELCAVVRSTRDEVASLYSYIEENSCDVDKITLTFKEAEREAGLREEMRSILSKTCGLTITSSIPINLELNAPGATKGNGLMALASFLNIKREETMAFGDGENDRSMLRAAGTGIAMGNGLNSLKEEADYVTLSNDEDGVACAIEQFVLL